jgi:hypothetical protein
MNLQAMKDTEALQRFRKSLGMTKRYKVNIRLLRVSAHQNVLGNELPHIAAQDMTKPGIRATNDLTAQI